MKSPITPTLIMGLVAAVSIGAASYFYPWPSAPTSSEILNKPLFEEYEYPQVRSLEITRFNRDTNSLDTIKLRRSGEKWVIPAKNNFVVTRSAAISSAVNSLNDRIVLEVMSDQQQDFVKYGVIDPNDYQTETNLAGLGVHIRISDRNNKEIASLIVGKNRKNDPQRTKRFVRRPGQPQVYAIDYDTNVLATDFPMWVNSNLLNLQTRENVSGNRPASIRIDNYRIDPANMASAKKQEKYLVDIGLANSLQIQKLLVPEGGEMKPANVTQLQTQELSQIARFLPNIVFTDVVKKDSELAKAIRLQSEDTPDAVFAKLLPFGFRKVGDDRDGFVIEAARGTISVLMTDGVEIKLLIGNTTGQLNAYSGKPDRYLMLTATVNEDFFVPPEKPATEDAESDENRAYLRAVAERKSKLKLAGDVAKAMNRTFSNWFYVIDETHADGLIPDITTIAAGPAKQAPAQEPEKG